MSDSSDGEWNTRAPSSRDDRLRVAVLAPRAIDPLDRALVDRIAHEPNVSLCGIFLWRETSPFGKRANGACDHGAGQGAGWLRRIVWQAYELFHEAREENDLPSLARTLGVPVYSFESWAPAGVSKSLRLSGADLGVHWGAHALADSVVDVLHKGLLTTVCEEHAEARAPLGYHEISSGDSCVPVSLFFRRSIDGCRELATSSIPIEDCETLESLAIKVRISQTKLMLDAVQALARGDLPAVSIGNRPRAPRSVASVAAIRKLRRHLRRHARRTMPVVRLPLWKKVRVFAEYLAVFPMLMYRKKRLLRSEQAPTLILFYHLVANRPLSPLGLPLEDFVRQVEFLRRYFEVLGLEEAVQRVRSGKNERIAVSITFDDGYRDNVWAIEYLKMMRIPAAFFVSIGHLRDGRPFEHDRDAGFEDAAPMTLEDLRQLTEAGFLIGAHGVYHEDFGKLAPDEADAVLTRSKELIARFTGLSPTHFSFPVGRRQINITRESFALAASRYEFVYSAYGGYNFPRVGRKHFLRFGDLNDLRKLLMALDGYTGFRSCLAGDSWGLKTNDLPPF